jgi:fructuronate reductase
MSLPRLSAASAVTGPAALPGYRPEAFGAGIVHIGAGAFFRAHAAAYTDAALAASGGDWRIRAVALRSGDLAQTLGPQDGRYTLVTRDAGGSRGRVIGAVAGVIAADPAATLAALCDPATRIVSLTVTERGYGIDRARMAADPAHPAVAADLAAPARPTGVLGLLAAALGRRRAAGVPPFAVLCCDNLPENGRLLRAAVVDFARRLDPALADHIAAAVAFPCTMVDRITPAPTDETRAEAARLTGCADLAAVEAEPFAQWVIEDRFPEGRPDWGAGGAIFVADVAPYEQMKLTMLNGAHSMLAYLGVLAGHRHVRDVMADPPFAALVRRHLAAASALLPPLPGIDLDAYAAALAARFANPALAHETRRIAMDGTEKLPQRLLAPALRCLAQGGDLRPFAFAVAGWMRHAMGRDEAGAPIVLHDPRAAEIAAALAPAGRDAASVVAALAALPGLFPPALLEDAAWRAAVTGALDAMLAGGVAAAIRLAAGAA